MTTTTVPYRNLSPAPILALLDVLRRGRREGARLMLHGDAGALVWRQICSGHRPVEVIVHLPLPVGHGIVSSVMRRA